MGGRKPEKMNGTRKKKGEGRGTPWNISLIRASNAQLQTPTIGSWSWLAKSTEIGATARSAFPNAFFSRFLRQRPTFQLRNTIVHLYRDHLQALSIVSFLLNSPAVYFIVSYTIPLL